MVNFNMVTDDILDDDNVAASDVRAQANKLGMVGWKQMSSAPAAGMDRRAV